jgi:hypothetical protein
MKITPLGAELMHSEGRTDMTKLKDDFCHLLESSYNGIFSLSVELIPPECEADNSHSSKCLGLECMEPYLHS